MKELVKFYAEQGEFHFRLKCDHPCFPGDSTKFAWRDLREDNEVVTYGDTDICEIKVLPINVDTVLSTLSENGHTHLLQKQIGTSKELTGASMHATNSGAEDTFEFDDHFFATTPVERVPKEENNVPKSQPNGAESKRVSNTYSGKIDRDKDNVRESHVQYKETSSAQNSRNSRTNTKGSTFSSTLGSFLKSSAKAALSFANEITQRSRYNTNTLDSNQQLVLETLSNEVNTVFW
jgi:hypothetical protein